MDSFRIFCENYDNNLTYLLNYLKDEPLPIINYRQDFAEWVVEDEDRVAALAAAMGISADTINDDPEGDWIDDLEWDHIDKMPKEMIDEFTKWWKDEKVPYHMQHNPTEVPTWAHMSLSRKTMLPRTTWLVHLTDDPYSVQKKGFNTGCDDVETLGLTTYLHQSRKKHGGYNFAFSATSHYMDQAAAASKYGKDAVMFQSSGVEVYHGGDEEEQIIFWGPAVKPRDIIVLNRLDYDEGWAVEPYDSKHSRDKHGGGIFKGKDIDDCVQWVIKNFNQYRRVLTGA